VRRRRTTEFAAGRKPFDLVRIYSSLAQQDGERQHRISGSKMPARPPAPLEHAQQNRRTSVTSYDVNFINGPRVRFSLDKIERI
jgi:hypothetical protein